MAQGIEYHVRAILEAKGGRKAVTRMQKFASGWAKSSQKIENLGRSIAGSTLQTASSLAKAAGAAGVLAGAAGLGGALASSVKFNASLEDTKMAMSSTLQLMGHAGGVYSRGIASGMDDAQASAAQFQANVGVAETSMDNLFRMAAKSPASFEQATDMFRNMLPGARSVTGNMERIETLAKNSLALGMIMGGDFRTTGAQMSRVLTGGAGAEFETWKVLQKSIVEAGKAAEYFDESLALGEDSTRAFNKLSPAKRFELIEKATMRLGSATEAYGDTWAGLTSTIVSDIQLIQQAFGKGAFEVLKNRMKLLTATGGVLDVEGPTIKKLEAAFEVIGDRLGKHIGKFVDYFAEKLPKVVNDWPDIAARFQKAFDKGLRMAKILLKVATARAVLGGAMMVGGRAAGMAGAAGRGLGSAHKSVTNVIGKLGNLSKSGPGLLQAAKGMTAVSGAALFALPILVVLGMAVMGVFAVVGGALAYFISRWDSIVTALNTGTLTLGPLLDALEVAWNGLALFGQALFGGQDAVSGMQMMINFAAEAVYGLIGALTVGVKTLGVFQFFLNGFIILLKGAYLAFVALGLGIVAVLAYVNKTIADLLSKISTTAAAPFLSAAETLSSAGASMEGHMRGIGKTMRQDFKDGQSLFNAADKLTEGLSEDKFRKKFEDMTDAMFEREVFQGPLQSDVLRDEATTPPGAPKGSTTHIHKMVVNQDLRNQDPDRVIGAFYRAVDNAVTKRTQATTLPQGGI